MEYKAPLRDLRFAYYELFDGASLAELPGYEEATPDLVESVLEEMGKIATEVLQPINSTGDEEGCTFKDGEVIVGFTTAYSAERQGWFLLPADEGSNNLRIFVVNVAIADVQFMS